MALSAAHKKKISKALKKYHKAKQKQKNTKTNRLKKAIAKRKLVSLF